MSESGDYNPGAWSGYSFKDARKDYDMTAARSYSDAVSQGKTTKDLLVKELSTDSSNPLLIAVDVTGSMQDWPATIFSKLGYLDNEIKKEYLGEDAEVCFAAIGDAFSDKYPLQARPFVSGIKMRDTLKEIVLEGGGGGSSEESYELAALYFARKVSMPKVVKKPTLIFIGDEQPYSFVDKVKAQNIVGVTLTGQMSDVEVFKELMEKFSVYLIRKAYGSVTETSRNSADQAIQDHWERLIGADHIAFLPSADRVVDVIFGILAKEADRVDYFKDEITNRQKPEQVKEAFKSLKTIYDMDDEKDGKAKGKGKKSPKAGGSKLRNPGKGKDKDWIL